MSPSRKPMFLWASISKAANSSPLDTCDHASRGEGWKNRTWDCSFRARCAQYNHLCKAASHIPQQLKVIFSISSVRRIEKHYFLIYFRISGNSAIKIRNRVPWIRHTHASLLLFAGVSIASVSKRLWHASMNTTQEIYLHVIRELENKDVDIVMRALSTLI